MRLHLDTSFLIDWSRQDRRVTSLADEILDGLHAVSIDTIVETEYFAAVRIEQPKLGLFEGVRSFAQSLSLTSEAAQLAASWLAPMDKAKRKAHFADALIGAIATLDGATLVTGDRRIAKVFPHVSVQEY